MIAGVRKIPPPMVEPMRTATALHNPSWRGSRSPQRSGAGEGAGAGAGDGEADMRGQNIHFGPHDAIHPARVDRGHVHLSAHHPRRHRPDHRIGPRLRRAMAILELYAATAARTSQYV